MELKELTENVCLLFGIEAIGQLGQKLMKSVLANDVEKLAAFCDLVQQDLSIDWLQKIYQYYMADRKQKMQDYTPKSLARLMGSLAGEADEVIDMCAGSGALTIQKWNINHGIKFLLYEFDENVIPYLLFNMAIRNIECEVFHMDVLSGDIYHTYRITKGDRFGKVEECRCEP